MKILIVSAEAAPFAKVGGLADVAGALPKALRELGHDARLVMPLYRMIEDDPRWALHTSIPDFEVHMNAQWTKQARFVQTEHEGVPVGFIGTDEWFIHSVSSETLYQPGGMMHLFFCAAVLRAMEELDWIPDIIHVNDWHTGFLPVLMRTREQAKWCDTATVFTIHNLAYQGEFGVEALDALGLPHDLFHYEHTEAYGHVNFLKAGCTYAEKVNTVSENYAREIQTPEYGARLDGLMRHLAAEGKLSGILNGIDTDVFNPETDPDLPFHFSAADPADKARDRKALMEEIGLPEMEGVPVFGVVSRLSSQKGLDLIVEAAETLFALPVQLVVQGLGEPPIAEALRKLEARFPNNFKFLERFDAPLAQRVYAGCDGFLMPSKFEPCGLGQLIAMRYGTVPVVRHTGGLADTVFEGINGFVFEKADSASLIAAVGRAKATFGTDAWQNLLAAGMRADFGWSASAQKYVKLYESAHSDCRSIEALTA